VAEAHSQLRFIRQFFIRDRLDVKLVTILKPLPGPVSQGRRCNQQRSLSVALNDTAEDFAAAERAIALLALSLLGSTVVFALADTAEVLVNSPDG